MVTHKQPAHHEPHYFVDAKVMEPDYEAEEKYVNAELVFVRRKIAEHRQWGLAAMGFFGHKHWRRYAHKLENYLEKLHGYREEVEAGDLPVKFSVFNDSELPDEGIHVKVKVSEGHISSTKKVPQRPERLDAPPKPWKFSLVMPGRFKRSDVKITPHAVAVRFSALGANDGAVLVNKVVHIQCGEETEVTYQLSSRNVAHESGVVELVQEAP